MANNSLIILPLLSFMLAAILCFFFHGKVRPQQYIAIAGSFIALICAIGLLREVLHFEILSMQVGGWQAPYGITIVVDVYSALMIGIACLLAFAVSIFSLSRTSISYSRQRGGYYPSLLFMLMGVIGSFITGDLFNLYVWFEVMLISSFVLMTLGSKRKQLEGGLKYMVLNFVASTFLLLAIGILYGVTGHTNMAMLSQLLKHTDISGMVQLASVLLLVSFTAKAAMFPLFFWLPASYHTPPIAVTAVMAGLLTKVGVYTLLRTYTLLFPLDRPFTVNILMIMACCTMLVGVLGALVQQDIRKVLAYNLISKIGFIIMGLAINSPLAIAASIFYTIHHILVKSNLFFVTGMIGVERGSFQIKELGGIYSAWPLISFVFMLLSLTLVGIPPLSGFYGKLMFTQAAIASASYVPIVILLLTSLLTLYSMIRVWRIAFLRPWDGQGNAIVSERQLLSGHKPMCMAIGILLVFTLGISIYAAPLVEVSTKAAYQLLHPEIYIRQVLGD
ncbi:proton-conducting transporter membrane subunit [Olivibacter sitiensis]|uniref:proton-conducting transporter transmembrane domain-containing protein n=1 Tax=Olivibacter sitiensis TaxID=376470 RepID=UPI00055A4785|nr:proton-conducting transporter membrane subunit [Olivibacter sitiensis]